MSLRAAVPSCVEPARTRDAGPVVEPDATVCAARVVTGRALFLGGAIGVQLAITNLYMGLKTGWWEAGTITASVLVFSLASLLPRGRDGRLSALENSLAQTVATAAGAMPATAGLLGTVPALALLGVEAPPGWGITAWGLALGTLGVFVALVLRRRLLLEERLAFPSGVATAEVVSALHASGGTRPARAWAVLGAGWISMGVTWLRDACSGWIPQATLVSARLGGLPGGAYTLGISWSPMLLAIGALAGPAVGLSLLLGALVAWGGIAPALVRAGLVETEGYQGFATWLAWPGVGLMTGSAVAFLGMQARSFLGAARDLRTLVRWGLGGDERIAFALIATGGLVLGLCGHLFGLGPLQASLALLLVLPLGSACARAAGQTDILPVGQMGQLTQVAVGAVGPARLGADVAAGSVVAGALVQVGTGMWSLKAGHLLGLPLRHQLLALLVGVFGGAAVSAPVYALVVASHGLGTAALPAPSAIQFKAIAELVAHGAAGVPPLAGEAALLGFLLGAALAVATRGGRRRWLPSAAALGLGFIAPAHYAVTICLGALLVPLVRALWPPAARAVPTLGAGVIAGESLMGVIVTALGALGLIRPA